MAGPLWNMGAYRADAAAGWPGEPEPEPPPPPSALDFEEDEVFIITASGKGTGLVAQGGGGVTFVWLYTGNDVTALRGAGIPYCTVSGDQFDAFRNAAGAPERVELVE